MVRVLDGKGIDFRYFPSKFRARLFIWVEAFYGCYFVMDERTCK